MISESLVQFAVILWSYALDLKALHVKVDNNDAAVNVRTRELHGVGDRCRRRVVRMWERVEMGKSGCV